MLAVRSRIQRSDLLELQREASIVASRIPPRADRPRRRSRSASNAATSWRVYDAAGDCVARATARRSPTTIVDGGARRRLAEGYVDGDLVAAAPVRRGRRSGARRAHQRARLGERRPRPRSVLLLGLGGVGVLAVAGVVGALLARRLSRPVERLRQWASTIGRDDAGPPPAPTGIGEIDELGDRADRRRRPHPRAAAARALVLVARLAPAAHAGRGDARRHRGRAGRAARGPHRGARTRACAPSTAWSRRSSRCSRWPATTSGRRRGATSASSCATTPSGGGRATPPAGRDMTRRAAEQPAEIDAAAVGHILDVLFENALVHGRGPVAVTSRRTGRPIEIDVGDEGRRPPRPTRSPTAASTPATASACAWPARSPSPRAASCASSRSRRPCSGCPCPSARLRPRPDALIAVAHAHRSVPGIARCERPLGSRTPDPTAATGRRRAPRHDDPPTRGRSLALLAGAAARRRACSSAAGAHADGPLTVSTPYPTIETQPGSTVKLDVNVASTTTQAVDLALGGLPDGWKATMRGGGFVVKAVTATPDDAGQGDARDRRARRRPRRAPTR